MINFQTSYLYRHLELSNFVVFFDLLMLLLINYYSHLSMAVTTVLSIDLYLIIMMYSIVLFDECNVL